MFKQQTKQFNTPITVNDVLTTRLPDTQPKTYLMSHLLAAGFRGTEYQLLVLMEKLTTMLVNQQAFEAVVEIKDFGNLDDIGIVLKTDNKPTAAHSYQVKYYNHPITAYDFFNQATDAETTQANETMHIGKFFSGWLAWMNKYPKFGDQAVQSIVYTNATVDATLKRCFTSGMFTDTFIKHEQDILIGRNPGINRYVAKNFLTKLTEPKVSAHYSTKTWEALRKKRFLDDDGQLTDQFSPNAPNFKLGLTKNELPPNVTNQMVLAQLKIIDTAYQQNLVDLWELLYQQAFAYLAKYQHFNTTTEQTEQQKKVLFQRFLKSFRFHLQQSNLLQCEATILKNLATLSVGATEPVFLCLYYAIREWFRREEHQGKVPILTDAIMNELIKSAILRSKELFVLQGRSEATFTRMLCAYEGRSVIRAEAVKLELCFADRGLLLVVGEKGLGKSGLIKQVLSQSKFHSSQYLVLAAADLTQDAKLRKNLIEVLKDVAAINIIVIDGAEALLELPDNLLRDFMAKLRQLNRSIVLTLPPDATQHSAFQAAAATIRLQPLTKSAVLTTFPELKPYEKIDQLIRLAQIPFHLSYILRLIKQMGKQQFNYLVSSRNYELEGEIVKLVIEGPAETGLAATRRLQWQKLALKIAATPTGLTHGVSDITMTQGLQLLIDDGMVIAETKNNQVFYRFQHDLLFEHGLVIFLMQKWEIAAAEETTTDFWKMINKYLRATSSIAALEKWLLIYWSRIQDDMLYCIAKIAGQTYIKTIITMAIITKKNDILALILQKITIDLDIVFKHDVSSQATYLLLAIWYDNPAAIDILIANGANLHHPQAGSLLLRSYSANYQTEAYNESSVSNSEDSESEENTDFTDRRFHSDYDSEEEQEIVVHETDSTDEVMETINDFVRQLTKYWSGFKEEPVEHNQDYDDFYFTHTVLVTKPNYDDSYIHQAVVHQHPSCIQSLITAYNQQSQRQVINLQSNYQETPLHLAVLNKDNATMNVLVNKGASIDLQDFWGETPLHNAVYKSDLTAAETLLTHGADPNCTNKKGLTPYHIAIAHLNIEMVKLLFSYGGDLSLAPFAELTEGMAIADLLEKIWDNCHSQEAKDNVEYFVLELVQLLNYGWDEKEFTWGNRCDSIAPKIRTAQLKEVEDLMTLVEGRAQLSELHPGFDYWDDESKLEYAVDNADLELLDELTDYILDDTESIAQVLESDAFNDLKQELLDQWLADASVEQYRNVQTYAEEYEDEALLMRIKEDLSYLDEDEETEDADLQWSRTITRPSVAALSQSLSRVLQLSNSNTTTTLVETDDQLHQFSRK